MLGWGGYKKPKDKEYDTKENMPAVTEKYQQRARGDQRRGKKKPLRNPIM